MANAGKKSTIITRKLIQDVLSYKKDHNQTETSRYFNISQGTVSNIVRGFTTPIDDALPQVRVSKKPEIEKEFVRESGSLIVRSLDIKTLEEALRVGEVDLVVWEVERYVINSWEVTAKDEHNQPQTYTNWQVKVWLKRRTPEVRSLELLLEDIKKHGPIVPLRFKPNRKRRVERELEISLMDPHLGLRCFVPSADHSWDIETCTNMVLEMLDDLLDAAKIYGPFQRIILPIGNDLFHADNVYHTTTQGTLQPEMDDWQHVYVAGEKLSIIEVQKCLEFAPVKVIAIMGNHDRQSVFTLGRLLAAYFHNNSNVIVDDTANPYKFHRFGVNLIGFEHGHSIKQTVRLAALMAQEVPQDWAATTYREWHLGDQHRKGSASTSMMEEQGVGVEFLAGLTPGNSWHRIKALNNQKRGGSAFVWDRDAGPIARLQAHIGLYSNRIMK